jgi:hypothetical protein
VYEEAFVIAVHETVIDFKVFEVALTVGAEGVANPEVIGIVVAVEVSAR